MAAIDAATDPREEMPSVTASQVKTWEHEFNTAMSAAEKIRAKYAGKAEGMTPTEEEEWTRAIEDADSLKSKLVTGRKALECEAWGKKARSMGLPMGGGNDNTTRDLEVLKKAHLKSYRQFLSGQPEYNMNAWRNTAEFREFTRLEQSLRDTNEYKAYQSDNPAGFGFAVPPQELVATFITLMKDLVFMRGMGTIYPVPTAESLGVPAIDTDPSDADWTIELGTGNAETTVATGKREFRPHPVAKSIKLSKKLLRQIPNVESVIMDRLGYKMGVTEEKAFLTGTGADQPLGCFTASAQGISTGRDVTAATTTSIAGDDIIGTFYNLKAQYRRNSSWILNRTVVSACRKLKDTTNNYLWTTAIPGSAVAVTGPGGGLQGTPEMLMGRPVNESEYAPGTLTAALYVAIVGDFRNYWIADALDMQMQVLYELYAATNQMGYILRKETDGVPVLEEAFSRLILHA